VDTALLPLILDTELPLWILDTALHHQLILGTVLQLQLESLDVLVDDAREPIMDMMPQPLHRPPRDMVALRPPLLLRDMVVPRLPLPPPLRDMDPAQL